MSQGTKLLIRPSFFDDAQQNAAKRWNGFASDPEGERPWRLLFNQVKNPRHVLSELLQNADDAGATWASATVLNGVFEFRHDGHDFTPEEFHSLCKFGFSNKRRLLTIGFRGIGFRSVFSLGPLAEVHSPTIGCQFTEARFTEPQWVDRDHAIDHTLIRVPLRSPQVEATITRQIEMWQESPTPVLLFNSIRKLALGEATVDVKRMGEGPCSGSVRFRISGVENDVLLIKSSPGVFPPGCLEEVREERGDPSLDLPPCEVVVVLGAGDEGRLHVVLPTELCLSLPVSLHAPFIQDPARTRIKEPSESQTNAWLLSRVGKLLAETMMEWLGQVALGVPKRARAYALLPASPPRDGSSLAEEATRLVLTAFQESLAGKPVLLAHTGALSTTNDTVGLPRPILETWEPEIARTIFSPTRPSVLAPSVGQSATARLRRWGLLSELSPDEILTRLGQQWPKTPVPTPVTRLAPLWAYLEELIAKEPWKWREWWSGALVMPAAGETTLFSARDILVSASKPASCSDSDWEFLQSQVRFLDSEWAGFLRRTTAEPDSALADLASLLGRRVDRKDIERVQKVCHELKLVQSARLDDAVQGAALKLLRSPEHNPTAATQLQLIAARYDIPVRLPDKQPMKFLCRDGKWRSLEQGIVAVDGSDLEELIPVDWLLQKAISDEYLDGTSPEERRSWFRWVTHYERCGIPSFPIPEKRETYIGTYREVCALCTARGGSDPVKERKRDKYYFEDWDWDPELLQHWEKLRHKQSKVWADLVLGVLRSWSPLWAARLGANVKQDANAYIYTLRCGHPTSAWIGRLRDMPCLPDEYGALHLPSELLRRTQSTVALLNVEPFVHETWDQPAHTSGLDSLGVRSSPVSAGSLLERLRAHVGDLEFPITRLLDLYRAIDRLSSHLSSDEWNAVAGAFTIERLVRTTSGWEKRRFVFLDNPHGIPGVACVHPELQNLSSLWQRLGLRSSPGLADALDWLRSQDFGAPRCEESRVAARALLARYPEDAWRQGSRWLNCQGSLVQTSELRWICHDRRLTVGLFQGLRAETADMSMVPSNALDAGELGLPPTLESLLRLKVVLAQSSDGQGVTTAHPWMVALGDALSRLRQNGDADAAAVREDRALGRRLQSTRWASASRIRVQIHLDGIPAGPETDATVAWDGDLLHVCGTLGGAHRAIVHEISRCFQTEQARNAIGDCVGRESVWIEDYARSHLSLDEHPAEDSEQVRALTHEDTGLTDTGPRLPSPPVEATNEVGVVGGSTELARDLSVEPPPGDVTDTHQRTGTTAKPREPGKWARLLTFLKGRGFTYVESIGHFVHPEGHCVLRGQGLFPWNLVVNGDSRVLWQADSSFDEPRGLELPAEVWVAGCELRGILLEPSGDTYLEHDFVALHEMVAVETLGLFPAVFRLKQR